MNKLFAFLILVFSLYMFLRITYLGKIVYYAGKCVIDMFRCVYYSIRRLSGSIAVKVDKYKPVSIKHNTVSYDNVINLKDIAKSK